MLGCHKHDLQDALLTRSLTAGVQEMLTVPLNETQARKTRDMFAQEVPIVMCLKKNQMSSQYISGGNSWNILLIVM